MEIALAVLLFFGGFTLGSITADNSEDDVQSAIALSNGDGVSNSYPVAEARHQNVPTRCRFDGAVIYRDLTVPYRGKVGEQASHTGDCEGECPDE
jgi:hypothetical protein